MPQAGSVLTSESRRLGRADKRSPKGAACGAPPAAARPGSSEVEQPPCKRPVGGSNPFPGSCFGPLWFVEKSAAFATIVGRSAECGGGVAGGVPERPKGADCKSAGFAYGGSNPPAPTNGICPCSSVGRA